VSARCLPRFGLAAALLGLTGCYSGQSGDGGETDGESEGGEDDGDNPGPGDPGVPLCDADSSDVAGPRLLRRLTVPELDASVRSTFGLDAAAWAGPELPPDPAASSGFTNDADRLRVSEAFAGSLQSTAEGVAEQVSEPARLAGLLPCSSQGGSDCAKEFVERYGALLYRRPLTEVELARFADLHAEVSPEEGFAGFVYWATVALMQSPNFVYRSELGDPGGDEGYTLSPYEVATALAYTFTGTQPDAALLEQAAAGGLQTSEAIVAAARALAKDADDRPSAALRARLHAFNRQWLGLSSLANLDKDSTLYPGFTPEVKASMQVELDGFLEQVIFEEGGGVQELLTADHSVLDAALASFYGFGEAGGVSAKPAGWGTGILSLGGVLAAHSTYLATSPTQRGYMVRSKLLCDPPPPPPPDVGDLPEPSATETTRQRYEMHASNPSCAGCHNLMDPIGYGFESLDASGRFRETDNGYAIDNSGSIVGLDGESVDFVGPVELANALAGSDAVAECVTAQMASYAFGLESDNTRCIVDGPAAQVASGELGLVDAFVAFAGTRHFLHRN